MTKKTLLTLVLFLLMKVSFSQTIYDTEKTDSTNIYLHSLTLYCKSIDNSKAENEIVYVERNYLFTDKLPKKIDEIDINYVEGIDLKKAIKNNGGTLTVVRIVPLRVKNNEFFINLIPFHVTYKRKKFNFGNGGGLGVKYEFDSELKGLVFKKSEWGGI